MGYGRGPVREPATGALITSRARPAQCCWCGSVGRRAAVFELSELGLHLGPDFRGNFRLDRASERFVRHSVALGKSKPEESGGDVPGDTLAEEVEASEP